MESTHTMYRQLTAPNWTVEKTLVKYTEPDDIKKDKAMIEKLVIGKSVIQALDMIKSIFPEGGYSIHVFFEDGKYRPPLTNEYVSTRLNVETVNNVIVKTTQRIGNPWH